VFRMVMLLQSKKRLETGWQGGGRGIIKSELNKHKDTHLGLFVVIARVVDQHHGLVQLRSVRHVEVQWGLQEGR
jgi:hypothetical protein